MSAKKKTSPKKPASPKTEHEVSPAIKPKIQTLIDEDMKTDDVYDEVSPTGERDPNFDRKKALAELSLWYATAVAMLNHVYDSTAELRQRIENCPELADLVDAKNIIRLTTKLDALSSDVLMCYPRITAARV